MQSEIPQHTPEGIEEILLEELPPNGENIEEIQERDSYDELAGEIPDEPVKRGRGRPKGAKNKPKAPPPQSEPSDDEPPPPKAMRKNKPAALPEEEPLPPKRKRRPKAHALEAEFDEGYGGAGKIPPPGKPVRIERPRSLMDVVAEAARERGSQERNRRRSFYDSFLPM